MRDAQVLHNRADDSSMWPGVDAIATCPGTGEKVDPDSKRMHVLVAHSISGMPNARAGAPLRESFRGVERLEQILALEGTSA